MTNTTAKFTKRNALETLLALDEVKTDSRLVAYCENEIALLDKKKMSKKKVNLAHYGILSLSLHRFYAVRLTRRSL